jgi:mannitol/fructose-specific phosphotransferase system IIA component
MRKKLLAKMAVCLFGLAAIGYEHLAELNQLTRRDRSFKL